MKQCKHKKPPTGNKKGELTMKQKLFCREYIYDWNATRSYLKAYPNTKNANTAGVLAHALLRNPKINGFITEIQKDLEKTAGISKLMIIEEHKKIIQNTISGLHDTWITRKEFEKLTEEQKSCIAEISTSVKTVFDKAQGCPIEVEYVKIKLYDKQKSLDSINKMMGYDAPEKIEHSGEITTKSIGPIPIVITTPEQQAKLNEDNNPADNA